MEMTKIGDRTVTFDNTETIKITAYGKTYSVAPGQAIFFEDEGSYRLFYQSDAVQAPQQFDINVTGRLACTDSDMVAVNRQEQMNIVRDRIVAAKDAESEKMALEYITPGFKKMMEYQEKYRQALLYKADNLATVNMLSNEAAIDEMTIDEKADQVIASHDAWEHIADVMNQAMTQLKKDLREAETMAQIEQIALQFQWPAELPTKVLA